MFCQESIKILLPICVAYFFFKIKDLALFGSSRPWDSRDINNQYRL